MEVLGRDDLPVIRHHYFLSLDDSTVDRVSFAEISNSLMNQMAGRHPDAVGGPEDSPDKLREWMEACGAYYAMKGKCFFVVIDGLDQCGESSAIPPDGAPIQLFASVPPERGPSRWNSKGHPRTIATEAP